MGINLDDTKNGLLSWQSITTKYVDKTKPLYYEVFSDMNVWEFGDFVVSL